MPRGVYPRKKRGPYKKKAIKRLQMIKKGISRSLMNKTSQPHYHVRWEATDRTINLANTSTYVDDAFQFQLNLLQQYSELTALYDQYKITKVIMYLNWSPLAYTAGINDTAKTPELMAPMLMYVRDHDDSTPLLLSDFKQIGKTKQIRIKPGKQYKIVLTPSILTEAYRTGVTTAYMPKFGQKLDCGYPDIQHYGIKFGVEKPSISLGQINIRTKYYVTCYNTR